MLVLFFLQELDSLRAELEDALEENVAATETRNKLTRVEQEVTQLKKALEASTESHDEAVREMRRTHSHKVEDLNDQVRLSTFQFIIIINIILDFDVTGTN